MLESDKILLQTPAALKLYKKINNCYCLQYYEL